MALTKIDDRGLTTPIDLLDNEKIRFGTTDNDLEIFHGSNISTIKDGKGDLRIMSDTIRIQRNAGGENYIYATEGGAVKLHYDGGNPKLETTANGAKVTGTAGSYALEVNHPDWNTLKLINTNANDYGAYLDLYHNSSSPADGDEAGEIRFLANDDAGGVAVFGQMRVLSYDVSNGSEDGQFDLQLRNNDALEEKLKITSTGNALFSANEVKLYNATDTANTYFYAQNTGGGNAGIKMKNSSGEWTIIANDRLRFIDDDASLERLSIDSTGAVGIAVVPKDNDGNYRQLQIGLGAHFYGRTDDTPVYISSNGYRDSSSWKYTANTTASRLALATNMTFKTAVSGTADNAISWQERMTIYNSGGDVELHAGNLKVANGKGIDFGATGDGSGASNVSEILNDYEQGNFTPSISSTSRSGTITYTNAVGFYTKIGNRVFGQVYMNISGGTNTANDFIVDGLPYSCVGTASHEGGGYHTYMGPFFTAEADRQNTPWVGLGANYVKFYDIASGSTIKGNDTSTSSNYLIFHVQYEAA